MKSLLLSLALLVAPALSSVVYPRFRAGVAVVADADGIHLARQTVSTAHHPAITAAPRFPHELVRARATTISLPACVTSCLVSVLSSDTPCAVTDLACGCQSSNALIIESRAAPCMYSVCGYVTAYYAWNSLEMLCATIGNANVYATYTASDDSTDTDSTSTTRATTKTASTVSATGASRTRTTTATATATETSSSISSSGSSSNSGGKSSLSTGTIVGIAIGAAGGAVLICAICFLIYRCTGRRSAGEKATAAAGGPAVSPSAPSAATATAVPFGQPRLDGKSTLAATSITPTPPPPTQSVSPITPNAVLPPVYSHTWQTPPPPPQQYAELPQPSYAAPGYTIAPGQAPQAVSAAAGYAPAHPSQPQPGVLYQEAPSGTPAPVRPQELAGVAYHSGGMYEMPAQQGRPQQWQRPPAV